MLRTKRTTTTTMTTTTTTTRTTSRTTTTTTSNNNNNNNDTKPTGLWHKSIDSKPNNDTTVLCLVALSALRYNSISSNLSGFWCVLAMLQGDTPRWHIQAKQPGEGPNIFAALENFQCTHIYIQKLVSVVRLCSLSLSIYIYTYIYCTNMYVASLLILDWYILILGHTLSSRTCST